MVEDFEQKTAAKIAFQLKDAIYAKKNSTCESEIQMNTGAIIELRILIFNLFSLSSSLFIEEIFRELDKIANPELY